MTLIQMLVVGFYLTNLGYVSLMLKISDPVRGAQQGIEALATKMGMVLLVLGGCTSSTCSSSAASAPRRRPRVLAGPWSSPCRRATGPAAS